MEVGSIFLKASITFLLQAGRRVLSSSSFLARSEHECHHVTALSTSAQAARFKHAISGYRCQACNRKSSAACSFHFDVCTRKNNKLLASCWFLGFVELTRALTEKWLFLESAQGLLLHSVAMCHVGVGGLQACKACLISEPLP